jgi:hypothetical protein
MNYQKIRQMIIFHWASLIAAFIIGLVLVGPFIYFIYKSGNEYKGIYMFASDAELHYLARMNIGINEWTMGNPFFDNEEGLPSPLFTVSEIFLAIPSKVIGINVPTLNLVYKFLLPAVCSLFAYSLLFKLTKSRRGSIAGMTMIMIGSFLFNIPDLIHLFKWESVYGQFLPYDRPVNPQLSSILFFLYLYLVFVFLTRKSNGSIYAMTFLLGLSFYVYFYSFTFFLCLNFVLLFYLIYKKDYISGKKLVISTVLGIVMGFYAIINIYSLYSHPYFESLAKLGDITYSHAPIISLAWLMVTVAFVSINFIVKYLPFRGYMYVLLLTSFLVINQQVITGISLQQGHYHWYFNVPIFVIVTIYMLTHILKNKKRFLFVSITILICFLSILQAFLVQSSSYKNAYKQTIIDNKYASILDWLGKKPRSVILTENSLSALIPVYTNNQVVWEDHASYYLMNNDRRKLTNNFVLKNLRNRQLFERLNIDFVVLDQTNVTGYIDEQDTFLKEVYKDDTFVIYAFPN